MPDFGGVQTQKFTSIVLTLMALSFFGLLAINPTLSTIAKIKKEIADNETVNQKLGDKIVALSSLQKAYSRLENDVPIVFDAIPNSPFVPLFIGQIQSTAKNSNIHLSSLQTSQVDLFGEQGESKRYYLYSFSLTVEGLYEDLSKFIKSLTNMQRVVNINVFSITKGGAKNNFLLLSLQGVTYYKK